MVKLDPEEVSQETVTSPELSVAVGVCQFTIAVACCVLVSTVMSDGHVLNVGGSLSMVNKIEVFNISP